MKGWQIFAHSVRLVFSNLEQALRVSLVLYLVQVANQVAFFLNPPEMVEVGGMSYPEMSAGGTFQSLILGLLAVVASLWIAVAWHRFVLAEEYPQGWLPRWHGSNMLSYLGRSILVGLLITLAVLVVSVPLGLITMAAPGLAALLPILMVGLAAFLFFRLSVMLPAAALGHKMKLGEAWEETSGETDTILVLAAVVAGASILIQLPTMLNGDPGSFISLIYGLVVNWFATIIGISLLTTLYGHFIEKRPID
ncbi:hypothetical protein ACOXXX_11790 [Thalassococcus sp. BH17M4-6]|uniref:hypothetical protein n=1 Tax=Thalassococcus sp. BH17M4-6 TaxID=3413148 RepID=UPI003BD34E58